MINRILLYLALIYLSPQLLPAQEASVNEQEYEALAKELGYSETKKGLRLREKYIQKPAEKESVDFKKFAFVGLLLKLIAYVLVLVLVGLIIYMIFSNIQVDKRVEEKEIDYDEIEDLEDIDAVGLYKTALVDGDYKLAIRMHFIICLQKLSQKNEIEWEKEKTNRHYYREISSNQLSRAFRDIANVFERCWYADVTIELSDFKRYDQKFLDFLNGLK